MDANPPTSGKEGRGEGGGPKVGSLHLSPLSSRSEWMESDCLAPLHSSSDAKPHSRRSEGAREGATPTSARATCGFG